MHRLIAEAGQEIRDADCQLIGHITRDIVWGDRMMPSHFVFADGTHPRHGEPVHPAITQFIATRISGLSVN